jgi:arylsulfatase A-like enzyme
LRSEEDFYTPKTIREAVRWLDHVTERQRDRLFLWVDLFDPHEPWDPPPPYDHMYRDPSYDGPDLVDPVPGDVTGYMSPEEVENTRRLYAGEVTFVDAWMGVLLEKIRNLGLDDNTLIIHTTDHGEPFGEHGFIRKARPKGYQYLIRIPWIIRPPRFERPGTTVDALVQSVDMTPTILDFLGLANGGSGTPPDGSPRRGSSLVPLLNGTVDSVRDVAYGGWFDREWYACDGEWSYLLPIKSVDGPELYHLPSDPGEQRNLVGDEPARAAEMELGLRRFVEELRRAE